MKYGVHSEAGKLHKVMVCSPGLAHQRLTPRNCDELLFDDVIWLSQAKRDHCDFVTKMRERGVEVLEMHNLLTETVHIPEALAWILDRKIRPDTVGVGLANEVRAWMESLEPCRLAEFLIGGVVEENIPDTDESNALKMYRQYLGYSGFVLPPLPNTLFTRDTTCWIYGGVSLNPMYWPARRQETLPTTAIYKFHPDFAHKEFEVWYGDPDREHGMATLEGGDVMPIGKGLLLIGMGERTSRQAIGELAQNLFAKGTVERIIVAGLPKVSRRDASGYGIHLLRPGPGHRIPRSGQRDRSVLAAARRFGSDENQHSPRRQAARGGRGRCSGTRDIACRRDGRQ
ncbi:hypothetical protein PPGU19_093620 (plasmid) [Paraburkholderia sp. PGU19]|nr:hypothetical protein PPGU19_093620 [Paraburkholderia sp. PGU19]